MGIGFPIFVLDGEPGFDTVAKEGDELTVHGRVVVGDVEHLNGQVVSEIGEVLQEPELVDVLHDQNEIRPAEEFFRDAAARGGADAGTGDLDTRIVFVDGFCRRAAPLVAGTEEKNAHGVVKAKDGTDKAGRRHGPETVG